MTIKYLKKSPKTSSTDDTKTREIVENILKDIEVKKEEGCKELGKKFDKYDGEIIVSNEKIEEERKTDENFSDENNNENESNKTDDMDQKSKAEYNILEKKVEVLDIDETPAYGLETKVQLGINGVVECI